MMKRTEVSERLHKLLGVTKQAKGKALDEAARLIHRVSHGLPAQGAPNETHSYAPGQEKIAALCFDRCWTFDSERVPPEVGFFSGSDIELLITLRIITRVPMAITWGKLGSPLFEILSDDLKHFSEIRENLVPMLQDHYLHIGATQDLARRFFAASLTAKTGCSVVPVYETNASFKSEYKMGDHGAIIASMSAIDLVDNEKLEWEQVLEFRRDVESRKAFRRFVHWLDKDMVGKPISVVTDEMGIKLELYRRAIKKHAIKTRLGIMESVVGSHSLISSGATAVASASLTQDLFATAIASATVATSVVLGKILISVQKSKLDLQDVLSGPGSEVAFVHDVVSKFDM